MNFKISIIIPIYNVEKYIEECIDSVISQITDEIEVILVNDGTPDKSIDIVKTKYNYWIEKEQFKILEQENAGPGAARNNGISISTGEYIGFLDSDDIILNNYFSSILHILEKENIDIVEFTYKRFDKISEIIELNDNKLYNLEGSYKLNNIRDEVFAKGVWFPSIRIFKKEIFDYIKFPEGVFYEDLICISQIYMKDYNVFFYPKGLLGYRINPNSTTNKHKPAHAFDMFEYYKLLKIYKDDIYLDIQKIRSARSIIYFLAEFKIDDIPEEKIIQEIKKIKKNIHLLKLLKLPDLLFFLFPKTYIFINKKRLKKSSNKAI